MTLQRKQKKELEETKRKIADHLASNSNHNAGGNKSYRVYEVPMVNPSSLPKTVIQSSPKSQNNSKNAYPTYNYYQPQGSSTESYFSNQNKASDVVYQQRISLNPATSYKIVETYGYNESN